MASGVAPVLVQLRAWLFAEVRSTSLDAAAVDRHWTAGQGTGAACATKPADPYGKAVKADAPLVFWRLDDEAIQALNMREFQGRNLTVNEAKPREDRPRSGSGGGYGGNRY